MYAKISGLNTAAPTPCWSAADLEPAVRAAVESFDASRLVCGGDWADALLNGDYERVWRETTAAIESVAGNQSERILATTAAVLYRLDA